MLQEKGEVGEMRVQLMFQREKYYLQKEISISKCP